MGVEVQTIHWRIKLAAVATIQALNLTSPSGGPLPVQGQIAPDDSNIKMPCVLVTNEGEIEEPTGGDSETLHTMYPLRVFVLDRNTGRQHSLEPWIMHWRRSIRGAFQDRALAGVGEVRGCTWVPQVIVDQHALPVYQLVVSSMLLKFYTVELRA